MVKRIRFAQNEGELEMQKFLNKINSRRMKLDLPEVPTDGRGNFIKSKRIKF